MAKLDTMMIGSLEMVWSLSVVQGKEKDVIQLSSPGNLRKRGGLLGARRAWDTTTLGVTLQPSCGRAAALTPIGAEGHHKADSQGLGRVVAAMTDSLLQSAREGSCRDHE